MSQSAAGAGEGTDDWWRQAFAADYLQVYAHRTDVAASDEVAGLLARLRLAPGPILDACCGAARHTRALRRAGLPVVGFDFSGDLVRAAQQPDSQGRIAQGDVRQPPMAGDFGAILLLFTAFGYFGDSADRHCLQALAGCLAVGGWLVVDLPDPQVVIERLVPRSERILADGACVEERRWIEGPRVCKDLIIRRNGQEHLIRERVRLYQDDEMRTLAEQAGLSATECWSSLRGPDLHEGRRVWWLQRPA